MSISAGDANDALHTEIAKLEVEAVDLRALLVENKALAAKVLADFDRARGHQLADEVKRLAAGDGLVADVNVPVVWERTVIREALYTMSGLQLFVGLVTDPAAEPG